MPIRTYHDLIVWQKAMILVTSVYRLTEQLPSQERFGLTTQLRRSAISIPANLAEGHTRHCRGDYRRFVSIACGSLAELETHLEIGLRLGLIPPDSILDVRAGSSEVGKMLTVLHRRLRGPTNSLRP